MSPIHPELCVSLGAGARLSPYEVQSAIGAGGMGEVYKARDTRLDRIVALKVLPSEVAGDPDLRTRFEREARAVAALDHPNICGIYDVGASDGTHYLVMPYLEGQTLAARLEKGPLPLDQALKIAAEIADAPANTHRRGVVHRDLKPGNVMLTKSGAKVLDFGLAKHFEYARATSPSSAVTHAQPLTQHGLVIGTLMYMAPEQLEGKNLDGRADLFAFGAVLYEMVVGKRAFQGDSPANVIAAVLNHEPTRVSALQPLTPRALDHVVERCLAKDPEDRWQSAADVVHELKWIAATGLQSANFANEQKFLPRYVTVLSWTVGVLAAGTFVWNLFQSTPTVSRPPIRLTMETEVPIADGVLMGAISPDGQTVVHVGERDRTRRLYSRQLNGLKSDAIPGTEGAMNPFFSPDGRWIGFATTSQLKKVALDGRAPVTICDAAELSPRTF